MKRLISPFQMTLDQLLQAAMQNDSIIFDELAMEIVEGIALKMQRPALRGWMLGKEVLSYRTNAFGLQCIDTCAKTWAIVDFRGPKPQYHSLLPN